ncbi:hypothetical protein jhhlp_005145 [Lomentospora prolificans]|uniref:Heterokaryon incompatibility domain-containing protein n=1 Tax=Lomentospora prolificans TaxID=41688 RepID=A0A2N3N7Q9_9PEZI|nr:hypothetical protein jhhlp_005145 [Lomentospora prolificans]
MNGADATTSRADGPAVNLPKLPIKARTQFNHATFRVPGNAFSRERADLMKGKISLLSKTIKALETELATLRQAYLSRKDVEDVERLRLELQDQTRRHGHTFGGVLEMVNKHFNQTKVALEDVFIPEDQRRGTGNGPSHDNPKPSKTAATEKKRLEELRARLRRASLKAALEDMKNEGNELQSHSSHPKREFEGRDPLATGLENGGEENVVNGQGEEDIRDEKRTRPSDVLDDRKRRDSGKSVRVVINGATIEEGKIDDVSLEEAIGGELGVGAERNDAVSTSEGHIREELQGEGGEEDKPGEVGEDEDEEASDSDIDYSARLQRKAQKKSNSTGKMKNPRKTVADLQKKIDRILEEMKRKDGEALEVTKEEEMTYEKLRQREYTDKLREEEHLDNDHKRAQSLVKIKDRLKRSGQVVPGGLSAGGSIGRPSRSFLAAEDGDLGDEVSESDSGNEESDSQENQLEQQRRIEDMLKIIQALDKRIVDVRRRMEKIEQIKSLREVLLREYFLENKWIKSQTSENARSWRNEQEAPPDGKDHFSSSLPPDFEIYNRPLGKGDIRLLVIWPAPDITYPLLCAVDTQSLNQDPKPSYAALSYHWGEPISNGRLYLVPKRLLKDVTNDHESWGYAIKYAFRISIRNNLFRALSRLRRKDGPVSLWVDFMCINQMNMQEKTQQLGEMVNIYNSAKNVCIWLGEPDDAAHSDDAMEFIHEIMDFAKLDRYLEDPARARKWLYLAELMRDRWFSRRWVVQEVSLAPERASVHCGKRWVSWTDFADAVSLLKSNQRTISGVFDPKDSRDGHNSLREIQSFGACVLLDNMSKLFHTKTTGQRDSSHLELIRPLKSLECLVTSLKTFDASDQRDLIYSLVCIASDTEQASDFYPGKRRNTDIIQKLDVDYSKTRVQVYQDFTSFCIASSGSLDIICRPWAMPITRDKSKGSDSKKVELPSWIPMLASSEFGEPENVYSGRKNGDSLVGPVDQPNYRASRQKAKDWAFVRVGDAPQGSQNQTPGGSENGEFTSLPAPSIAEGSLTKNALRVKGFKLGKVDKVSSRTTGGVILREALALGGWTGIKNHGRVPDRIWRTLVVDKDGNRQIPPTWYQRACFRCLELADTFNNGDLNVRELLQGHSETLQAYLERVRDATWNRRFFRGTRNQGHFDRERRQEDSLDGEHWDQPEAEDSLFGIGPPDMQKNDFICILYGCSVPVVLRELKGQFAGSFRLVGEVYVHGNMDGEAEEDHDGQANGQKGPNRWENDAYFCLV